MNKIKLYLVDYPVEYFKDACHKVRMYILNKFREWIYNYDINELLNPKIADISYYDSKNLRIGVFSPVLIVSKIIEKHFGCYGYYLLNIHAIVVDTQQEDKIVVTIQLYRPGLLIGKAGKDIDTIKQMLWVYFNKKVQINILELKDDVNKPMEY